MQRVDRVWDSGPSPSHMPIGGWGGPRDPSLSSVSEVLVLPFGEQGQGVSQGRIQWTSKYNPGLVPSHVNFLFFRESSIITIYVRAVLRTSHQSSITRGRCYRAPSKMLGPVWARVIPVHPFHPTNRNVATDSRPCTAGFG